MNVQFTDKIESIFKNTLVLIRENGFHGTPMSQIAKASDVAIGTIYHYFPSKENLIIELFNYSKAKVNDFIFEQVDTTQPFELQFKQVLKAFSACHLANTDIFSFMEQFHNSPFSESNHCSKLGTPYGENNIQNFLLKGIEAKILKPVDIVVLKAAFIGPLITFTKAIIFGKMEFSDEQLEQLINIIWNGVKQNNENE
ncbi:TetR/AcrR family transcriptional regulator [Sphingobacterium sp. Mn56C]|uniref:TetR/AcrR family transcriptional regulator n=1 Tax=Sphingobacterium sp. Mn56C TaxID=3395261 RepID=UPI003BC1DDEB